MTGLGRIIEKERERGTGGVKMIFFDKRDVVIITNEKDDVSMELTYETVRNMREAFFNQQQSKSRSKGIELRC